MGVNMACEVISIRLMLLSIDDLHAGGIEFVTYDFISGGTFQVILCTERIG